MSANERESFFNAVYEEHHRVVHAYVLGRVGDGDAAVDLLQETFIRVWRNLEQLHSIPASRHRYWIIAVARNLVIDHYRKTAAGARAVAAVAENEALRTPGGLAYDEDDDWPRLEEAIRGLRQDSRTLLLLQVLGGLSSSEIGEVVSKPAGTVRYQLSITRKRLAEQLISPPPPGSAGRK
jgi:RNA polymerase sigma-70 factor (ECF subfamily)